MQSSIESIKEFVDAQLSKQAYLMQKKQDNQAKLKKLELDLDIEQQSSEVIKQAAKVTQEQVKYAISEAGTLMLASIFEDCPNVLVEFDIKYNQSSCNIYLEKNDEKYLPMDESGFGEANIAGFGLRVAVRELPAQKTRPIIIADEPFMNLKGKEANIRAIQAVKKISSQLGLQVIMISDERADIEAIKEGADVVFKVHKASGDQKTFIEKIS